jgi:hypothetical protein
MRTLIYFNIYNLGNMKKIISIGSVLFFLAWVYTSCEPAIEENIGNSYILMSRSNIIITFSDNITISGIDTLFDNLKDTTIASIGVYRSGLSSSYPELKVNLKIDSVYLKSMIKQANDTLVPDVMKSSAVLAFKNSIMLPSNCYKFVPDVIIPGGERVGDVSLVVYRKKFARLKSSRIFLPIAIDTASIVGENMDKAISVVQLKNAFVFKKM